MPDLDIGIGAGVGLDHREHSVGGQVGSGGDILGEHIDAGGVRGGVNGPGTQGHGRSDQYHSPGHSRVLPGGTAPSATAGALGYCSGVRTTG